MVEPGSGGSGDTLPDEYKCPITYEMMVDPVFAADGHTYERSAIETWLKTRQTSPLSNERLAHKQLVPNRALKALIDRWRDTFNSELLSLATSGAPSSGTVKLEQILEKGADTEARDSEGNTPLMLFLQRDNVGAVRCLARAGASLLVRNDIGLTALDIAKKKSPRDPAVVTLIGRLENQEREKKKREDSNEKRARARDQSGNSTGTNEGGQHGGRFGLGGFQWLNNMNFRNMGGGCFFFFGFGGGFGWLSLLMLIPMLPMLWRWVQGHDTGGFRLGESLSKSQRMGIACILLVAVLWYSLTGGGTMRSSTFRA